ncbi:PX domain-containing protein EREX [Euphorbia lathyris]|uniref:PX domain-containing protein EREX n=1 Tax=Euphorbia lathyris TaxID=212925 RepID=UPI003313C065
MNMYTHDLSLFDFANFSDPIIDPISLSRHHHTHRSFSSSESSIYSNRDQAEDANIIFGNKNNGKSVMPKPKSPPRHRHDGMSPLPLGMDWSLPPRKWDGRDSIWPHDPHSGWSYCVTVPSWTFLSTPRDSVPVTFYRVQVGILSPEGITTTRGILRRYSEFLKLHSELRKAFPDKMLPPPPPKSFLRRKNRMLLEERRCSLEDWMEKLLSDIDISRSASVGTFLELEAAARSSFDDANSTSDIIPSALFHTSSDVSLFSGSLSNASDLGNDSPEVSELETPSYMRGYNVDLGMVTSTSEQNTINPTEATVKYGIFNRKSILENLEKLTLQRRHTRRQKDVIQEDQAVENIYRAKSFPGDGNEPLPGVEYERLDGHVRRLSMESIGSNLSSLKASEISNLKFSNLFGDDSLDLQEVADDPKLFDAPVTSNLQFQRDVRVILPLDERHKLNRVLNTARQRIATAKTDMEDLVARLNQEIAVRQFLTTKVKDMEVDLETTKNNCKENMLQAALIERERFTQMQWDVEELRRKCLEMETKLKCEQDERALVESAKNSIVQENEMLLQQLDVAREDLDNLQKHHEEFELKSKADVKLLVKEVKSLRSSESDLKQELSRLLKEKLEVERTLQKEKHRIQAVTTANTKLLHECEILRNRLQECSVNFLVEEEDKLIMDTSSPSDAVDILTTSDNRIGLLLAEAQLLAQDVENSVARRDESRDSSGSDRTDDELRKLLTEVFVDNARLRMQVNSVIRCAVNANVKSEKEDEQEETPSRKTVLSKFLER